MLVLLIAPALATRARLPGVVGLIAAGALLGPHALRALELLRDAGARTGANTVLAGAVVPELDALADALAERGVAEWQWLRLKPVGRAAATWAQQTPTEAQLAALWPAEKGHRYVVLTGGEPLLQIDSALIDALHVEGFEIAVESNGTVYAPPGIDWICISPKAGTKWIQRSGHELKLVYPQAGLMPSAICAQAFENLLLQPMDGLQRQANTRAAIAYCQANPRWRLSVQTHKFLEIR